MRFLLGPSVALPDAAGPRAQSARRQRIFGEDEPIERRHRRRYADAEILRAGKRTAPLARPQASVAVIDVPP
jgi:hypothetical protein